MSILSLPPGFFSVFVTKSHHESIITVLQARIDELIVERDLYRKWFLERAAHVKFPDSPGPAPIVATSPLAPVTTMSDLEQRKTFVLDRGNWTVDDREIYEAYWRTPMRAQGVPEDEHDYWYHQRHGNREPLLAFTADA